MKPLTPDLFQIAENIARENSEKIYRLERRRRGHLIFIIPTAAVISLFLTPFLWIYIPALLKEYEPVFNPGQIFAIVFPAVLVVFYKIFDQDYRQKAKRIFLPLMAAATGLQFRRGGYIVLGDLYDHKILPPYTTRTVEEGFKGRYRDFEIEFQDFHLSTVFDSLYFDWRSLMFLGLRTSRGVLIRISLNKPLRYHTVLMPAFLANGFLKRNLNKNFVFHKDVRFVYRKFNRRYTILSTHQIEAHYILDPAVIERVMKLGEKLDADWLEISFMKRDMVIYAQYAKNFFEIGGLFEPVNVLTIERALEQMQSLKSVLDVMELNPHAGLGATVPDNKKRVW